MSDGHMTKTDTGPINRPNLPLPSEKPYALQELPLRRAQLKDALNALVRAARDNPPEVDGCYAAVEDQLDRLLATVRTGFGDPTNAEVARASAMFHGTMSLHPDDDQGLAVFAALGDVLRDFQRVRKNG